MRKGRQKKSKRKRFGENYAEIDEPRLCSSGASRWVPGPHVVKLVLKKFF